MPSQKNVRAVEALRDQLSEANFIVSTGFVGLDVATLNQLRRKLRESGMTYTVVKNTLTSIAAKGVGKSGVERLLEGPTGLILGSGDPVQLAKTLDEYLRTTRISLTVRGGLLDGQVLSSEDVAALASLPSKQQLMARLVGQLAAPLSGLLGLMNSPVQRLAYVLNAPSQGVALALQRHIEEEKEA
ncbi:MAG: 50S ribosomal protein L10 [Chloroflexi bacterium]|nr:50S ribosomal protein L10 [Chloroflexota bacterium]